jgi:hypothetical protein
MLAHRYKIWSWGGERQSGQVDCVKYDVGIAVVAKRHLYEVYEVFNELVALRLGQAMGLPIPVGFTLEKDGNAYYCSGDVSLSGMDFPPADFEHLAINQPRIACGIALFDGWICNADRNGANLFYDTDDGTVIMIDHGNALLNSFGIRHLRQSDNEVKLKEEYCQHLRDFSSFSEWYDRLVRIPEHTIRDAMSQAASVGVDPNDATEAANFLIARRRKLWKLFHDSPSLFPKYREGQKSLFSPFEFTDDSIEYSI